MPPSRGGRLPNTVANQESDALDPSQDVIPAEKRAAMRSLLNRHDDHARLMFQLERYLSLVHFDPKLAKADKSAAFQEWQSSLSLWGALIDSRKGRAERRDVQRVRELYDRGELQPEVASANHATGKQKLGKKDPRTGSSDKPKLASSKVKISNTSRGKPPVKKETVKRPVKSTVLQNEKSDVTTGFPQNKMKRRVSSAKQEPAGKRRPSSRVRRASQKSVAADNEEASLSSDSDSSDLVFLEDDWSPSELSESDLPRARPISLVHRVPAPTVTHPVHVTTPQFGGNLGALLGSYKILDDDREFTEDRLQAYVEETAAKVVLIEEARQSGLLDKLQGYGTEDPRIPVFVEPTKRSTFWTNMLNQAELYSKVRSNIRRNLQGKTKKNSQMVLAYHRGVETASERERKDQERLLKQIARRIGRDVLNKWKEAEKVVIQRHELIQYEANKVKNKEYLNEVLEKSARILESRVVSYAPEDDTDEESEADRDASVIGSDEGESDRFTDSEEEDDDELETRGLDHESDDESLTVEELLAKYKGTRVTPDVAPGVSEPQLEKPSDELLRIYNEQPAGSDESESELSDSDASGSSEEDSRHSGTRSSLAMLLGGGADASDHGEGDDSDEYVSDLDASAAEQDGDSDGPHDESSDVSPDEAEPETPKIEEISDLTDEKAPSIAKSSHGLRRIETPMLMRGVLREYQRDGLDWLAGLYGTETNGILADEMGLGKTIQTISLLAYLAVEKHVWGPHLIVVPTSVMLNWEMEFKRFAPGFKVLTYYGNPQQRKDKRRGWNKEDTWHVCITSYQLVIQDQVAFKRKRWRYMILDEAHNIKNFRSQRWQALLNFNTERRLLLTGTPLQNNLVELWSLLYFLMPSSKGTQMMPAGFANLENFQEWFARPVDQMVEEGEEADDEARATISKLHQVLRPYLLRRLKADVEKQMPGKYEHIVYTKLSKRQRYLYDDFMSRAATKETLASGNFMSILNALMQLRKVCNHPDLFEVRPVVTSFAIEHCVAYEYRTLANIFNVAERPSDIVNFDTLNLVFPQMESDTKWRALTVQQTRANKELAFEMAEHAPGTVYAEEDLSTLKGWAKFDVYRRRMERASRRQHDLYLNMFRTKRVPIYGLDLRNAVTVRDPLASPERSRFYDWKRLDAIKNMVLSYEDREKQMRYSIAQYSFVTPAVVCLDSAQLLLGEVQGAPELGKHRTHALFHESQVRLSVAFPDKHLLQYDCGKLQRMSGLLRDLISGGHRALIFTQMTKVLDILEQFLNIHGWRYLRLDGATRIEERQILTERFNKDSSIPVFILSTRSGGLGINLTGADTVIFYDSDWNPAMDKQCQDRCHRIGQTRDVHIYRMVSEYTIESNILRKATQKTILDSVVIQEGEFTTDYFNKVTVQDLLGDDLGRTTNPETLRTLGSNIEALAQAEDVNDRVAANVALSEVRLDAEEFGTESTPAPQSATTPSQARSNTTSRGVSTEPSASGPADLAIAEAEVRANDIVRGNAENVEDEEGAEDLDQIGHIDDYMLHFIERGDFSRD